MKNNSFRFETMTLLSNLVNYQEKMESQKSHIQEMDREKILSWPHLNPDDREGLLNGLSYQGSFFERALRYSFIVLLHLVVENQLVQFCNELKEQRNLPIRSNEMSGDAIKRSKIYLQKVAGISNINWTPVEDLSKVRNCIVHAFGKVELSRDENYLRQMEARGNGLSITSWGVGFEEEGILSPNSDFCTSAVRDATTFFEEVFEAASFGLTINYYWQQR